METLERTRDALSHSHPGASTEEILMACMHLMLEKKARQRGLVESPLATPRPCSPDRIPAHVRREVMKRSGGRCEWVFENGERCNSTWQLEVDHLDPRALGGKATVDRCRAACRPQPARGSPGVRRRLDGPLHEEGQERGHAAPGSLRPLEPCSQDRDRRKWMSLRRRGFD
jgi:hypothetical protein